MNNLLKNKKYLIFDDILSKKECDDIEKKIFFDGLPWYINESIDNKGNFITSSLNETNKKWLKNKNVVDKGHLYHTFLFRKNFLLKNELVNNSDYSSLVENLLKIFEKKINKNFNILRIKTNLIFESKDYTKKTFGIPHIDSFENHYVLIYYVNACDGNTFLFNKKEKIIKQILPKKGRFLFFKGNTLHANGHPVKSNFRCVINFNISIND